MSYSHILVSVSVSPESHQLVAKAVAIARPTQARITLVTLSADPEMYNQLAAPMLEDIRDVIQKPNNFWMNLSLGQNIPSHKHFARPAN